MSVIVIYHFSGCSPKGPTRADNHRNLDLMCFQIWLSFLARNLSWCYSLPRPLTCSSFSLVSAAYTRPQCTFLHLFPPVKIPTLHRGCSLSQHSAGGCVCALLRPPFRGSTVRRAAADSLPPAPRIPCVTLRAHIVHAGATLFQTAPSSRLGTVWLVELENFVRFQDSR